MTVPPDSYQISLNIIEAIKQHPVLYCTEVKGLPVKLQEFKQKVWKRIADELGLDATWIRLKWKNLRDTYCRILKCKNKTEEGVRRKKWIFEDHLNFIKYPYETDYEPQCIELTKEYIEEINSGEVTAEGLLEQLEDRNNEDYTEYLEVLEETTADPVMFLSDAIETFDKNKRFITEDVATEEESTEQLDDYVEVQSKYRKTHSKRLKTDPSPSKSSNFNVSKKSPVKKNASVLNTNRVTNPIFLTNLPITNISTTPIKGLNSAKNTEQAYLAPESKSIDLFFDSMAQTVKKLPPKAQADIKMHICKLITEAEIQYSGQNLPQTTQQFIAPPGTIPKLVLIPCNMIDDQDNKN